MMNINQALDRLRGGGPELNAIADAIEAAIPVHAAMEIQRLHERVASAADGLLERDAKIERLREALNKEHACLAMELTVIRDHADSTHIKDLEWRREFIRDALNKEATNNGR